MTYNTLDVLGPLVDDVTISVSLHETTRGGANSATHVGDEEATKQAVRSS